jgi:hypothetical protein
VRVPVERTALGEDLHLAEGLPPLQGIVIFEGTVADLLRIQAAVRGEIDIFQEEPYIVGWTGIPAAVSSTTRVAPRG